MREKTVRTFPWGWTVVVRLYITELKMPIKKHYYGVQFNRLHQVNLLSLSQFSSLTAKLVIAAEGWRCIIDWCDATFLSEVMSLSHSKAFSLTADYSLRYLRELHWINDLSAELWHFPGLYDRWQTHPPSVSLSPFSPPLPLLIQNLSFAKGKKK